MMASAELSSLAGRIVLASLWQGVLLTSIAALGMRLAPRLSAATRFLLWTMTLIAIVGLPLLTAFSGSAATVSARPALQLSPAWGFALAGVWLLLGLYRVVELMLGARHLVRVARGAQPIGAEPSIAALLAASARPVQLCTSASVDAPCIAGFRSARLLLPEGLVSSLEEADLQAIVLHELEHLRRRDDWFNLASKLAIAVFPFNPSLLWLDRRLGLERELACDASVIATTHAPFRYAGSLTRLAEHRVTRRIAFVLAAWGRPSEVVQRVSTLLGPLAPASPRRRRTAIALVTTSLIATSFALMRAPQLVSFTADRPAAGVVATTDSAFLPATPAGRRWIAVPTAFHANGTMARSLPARLVAPKSRAALPFPALGLAAPASAQAARPMLTGAVQPGRAGTLHTDRDGPGLRPRRVRSAQPAAQLLETDFSTFAAVPFGDGWLIVQL